MTQLLNVEEFAAALGLRPRTVYKWTSRKMVPFIRVGGAVRFHPNTLAAIQDGSLQIEAKPGPSGRVRRAGRPVSRAGASQQAAIF